MSTQESRMMTQSSWPSLSLLRWPQTPCQAHRVRCVTCECVEGVPSLGGLAKTQINGSLAASMIEHSQAQSPAKRTCRSRCACSSDSPMVPGQLPRANCCACEII